MDVSCHRSFHPGTSLEPAVIPITHASSCTLQYFPYYVRCSIYSCYLLWIYRMFSWYSFQVFPYASRYYSSGSNYYWCNRAFQVPHSLNLLHKLLYFNFFPASFCTTFLSAGIAISISVHVSTFLFFIFISGLFAVISLSVCSALLLLLLLLLL